MNILYHFRVRGTGAERVHIAGMAGAFKTLGHDVEFISPSGVDPTIEPDTKTRLSKRARLLHACADCMPQTGFELLEMSYPVFARRKFNQVLNKKRFDFIYERYAFFNTSGIDAAKKHDLPLILEINEMSGYDRVRPQKFKTLAARAERYIVKNASLIITVSDFLREKAAEIRGGDSNIVVIPNGVSDAWLNAAPDKNKISGLRTKLGLAESKIIGFCGGLTHWHNFDFMLQVFADISENFPDCKLLVIGEGPMRQAIVRTADRLNISGKVVLAGMQPHAFVRDYVELFDVAFIPHSNAYRSPIKLFEYMGAGKPVVAPDTGPVSRVVAHGVDGMLFRTGNRQGAIHAITGLLEDSELRVKTGEKARDKISAGYLWRHHAAKTLELVKSL